MYDSVNLRLYANEAGGVSFLEETACLLSNVGEHNYSDNVVLTGDLGNLKVSLNRWQIKVKDGSLCKWALGDNFQSLNRRDVQRAIESLSDTLHLPMERAAVTRLDVAQNFIVKHPVAVYLNHLGLLKSATRLQEPNGLYYKQTNGRLCFYDKVKEQRNQKATISTLYNGRNVLRYEQRYTSRVAKQMGVPEITAAMLYDEAFYVGVCQRWACAYKQIQKINDITLNFGYMKNKQKLYRMGVLALIEKAGGEIAMIEQINEQQRLGKLSSKQAFDLRQAVKDANRIREGITEPNEAIAELDAKVSEAIKFYR